MSHDVPELVTDRLVLRRWDEGHRDALAKMHTDPVVMRDLGGPLDRTASDRKLDRFARSFEANGYGRWAIHRRDGEAASEFLGYAGVAPFEGEHPLGFHNDIGWRLIRSAWGQGFATEAAAAALQDVFDRVGLNEVLSYTAPDNARSQNVMERLGLRRDPSLDFDTHYDDIGLWHGLVWVATAPTVL